MKTLLFAVLIGIGVLLALWFSNVMTPPFELLAILLGVTAMLIWEQMKMCSIPYFGVFTIVWILFSVFVFYSIETLSKTNILIAVAVFLLCYIYAWTHIPLDDVSNARATWQA